MDRPGAARLLAAGGSPAVKREAEEGWGKGGGDEGRDKIAAAREGTGRAV
jgi:hypothetical protein